MTLITIDGPDRVGKTSLVTALLDEYPGYAVAFHNGPPPRRFRNSPNEAREHMLAVYARQFHVFSVLNRFAPTTLVVLDRAHLSEYVYGTTARGLPFDRRQFVLDDTRLTKLLPPAAANCHQGLVVTMGGHPETIMARDDLLSTWSADDRSESRRRLQREFELFDELAELTALPHVKLSTTDTATSYDGAQQVLEALACTPTH